LKNPIAFLWKFVLIASKDTFSGNDFEEDVEREIADIPLDALPVFLYIIEIIYEVITMR
jgi:hypothetical protein